MFKSRQGFQSRKGFQSRGGFESKGGISSSIPPSWQAYYPFSSDFEDKVSKDYEALFFNEPSFGGGGINTVANTNISVTTFQADKKGVLLDKDGNGGRVCTAGDSTGGGFVNGVRVGTNRISFSQTSGVTGKYVALVKTLLVGAVLTGSNGVTLVVVSMSSTSILEYSLIRNPTGLTDDAAIQEGFENTGDSLNGWDIDFSRSGYLTDQAQLAADRATAGDTLLASLPTPEQWDVSGDFRFGYIGIGKTSADIAGQVMLQTGNMGISTGFGITFAEIGASISALSVDSDTIVGECFIKYVGGMLSIVIDGAESTPVASAAPAIGAFAQVGANISNLLPAPGTYGRLLFDVL